MFYYYYSLLSFYGPKLKLWRIQYRIRLLKNERG